MPPTPPATFKQPIASLKERWQQRKAAKKRMFSLLLTDTTIRDNGNDNGNEKSLRPETAKRQKHGGPDSMGASSSTAKARESQGSKANPIEIDGEEDPAWMAPPRPKNTYGSRLQDSRPRRVRPRYDGNGNWITDEDGTVPRSDETSQTLLLRKESREARETDYLGSSLGSVDLGRPLPTSGGKNDVGTNLTTKKTAGGSALFDPVSTPNTAQMEDHLTGVAAYTSITPTKEKPTYRRAILKPSAYFETPSTPKHLSDLKYLPLTSPGHAFASSTPSLNRPLTNAAGRTPTFINEDSSTQSSESDSEPEDLIGAHNEEKLNPNADCAPLQPTRDAPLPPPHSATNTTVIETERSDDGTVFGDGYTLVAQRRKELPHEINQEDPKDHPVLDPNGYPIGDLARAIKLSLEAPDAKVEVSDEEMHTPSTDEEDEDDDEDEIPDNCIRFEVCDRHRPNSRFFIVLPLELPFHIFRTRVAEGLGWGSASGATFRFWAIKDASHAEMRREVQVNGKNWDKTVDWLWRYIPHDEDTSEAYIVVSDQAGNAPQYMSSKDREMIKERENERLAEWRAPEIFGENYSKLIPRDGSMLQRLGGAGFAR